MSDLQCPATVLLIARESIASGGGPALIGASQLSGVFVASSVAADPSGLAAAASLADQGGWRLTTMAEVGDGASLTDAIEHLADLHRGETIAVVATQETIQDMLGSADVSVDPITLAIDGSGWVVSRGEGMPERLELGRSTAGGAERPLAGRRCHARPGAGRAGRDPRARQGSIVTVASEIETT